MTGTENQIGLQVSPYDELRQTPEGEILLRMATEHSFSTAQAVEGIIALTEAAAAASSQDALQAHAVVVTESIAILAMHTQHDQQSKLINFTLALQKTIVSDPTDGGILEDDDQYFWSGMPQLSFALANLRLSGGSLNKTEEMRNQARENCTAFVAQLSEVGFSSYKESISWNYSDLVYPLEPGYCTTIDIRFMCMWFIYAPQKVWLDVQLRRKFESEYDYEEFVPEFWPEWKKLLQESQRSEVSDENTQELLRLALNSIDKIEAEH